MTPTVPIVVLGTDAVLAASPATPVQLAHACMRAGFTNVIPASWGDELIASGMLRRLPDFGSGPAIQCSCPIVAHRLLTVGGDLRPALVALVPPPVAIARYIKAVSSPTRTRITYVGACPGAIDESIDIRMTPNALIAMLAERQIVLEEQPRVFESIIPPDRRRHLSQPGGLPAADALWNAFGSRSLVELEGDDLVNDLAQQLLAGKNVLIDVATRLGCVCSGAVGDVAPEQARAQMTALEPPRASSPIVDELDAVDLDLPLPAVPRTPVDVLAVPHSPPTNRPAPAIPANAATVLGARGSTARGASNLLDPRSPRPTTPPSARPVLGSVPVARGGEGRSLPRAYIARRRSSPKGLPAISAAGEEPDISVRSPDTMSAVLTPPRDAPAIPERPITPPAPSQNVVQSDVPSSVPNALPTAAPNEAQDDVPNAAAKAPAESLLENRRPARPAPAAAPPRPAKSAAAQPVPILITRASPPFSSRQAIFGLIAVLVIALSVGAIVAVVVARSMREPPAPAGVAR